MAAGLDAAVVAIDALAALSAQPIGRCGKDRRDLGIGRRPVLRSNEIGRPILIKPHKAAAVAWRPSAMPAKAIATAP